MKTTFEEDWSKLDSERTSVYLNWYLIGSFIGAIIILTIAMCSPARSEEYTDEQIVNAIYKAEGGKNAQYPYGIRSIKCSKDASCRNICFNTIKNNRRRFAEYGYKNYNEFIEFLGSRYAPIGARNDKKKLNSNWIKNVNYFLING